LGPLAEAPPAGALLEAQAVGRRFGGLAALDDVSLSIEPGEIVGVIGPNGAGKTTLVNLLTGSLRPTDGEILFEGRRITHAKPHQRAALGIVRTHQIPRPLRDLTVADNVLVGALFGRRPRTDWDAVVAGVEHALRSVDLLDDAGADVATLSVGSRKMVELARCLAARPKVLLLDEVTAGLNPEERQGITELIARLAGEGIAVIVIEHVVEFIAEVTERLVVLDQGRRLADGPTQAVLNDERVVEAYLGVPAATGVG